jgi:hypothetical protein
MTLDELSNDVRAAGHFAQLRKWGNLQGVELAHGVDGSGCVIAPLLKVIRDGKGRWLLTVFGEVVYSVPQEHDVLPAALEQIRLRDDCMSFSPETIRKYNLTEIDASELRTQQ